MRHQKVSRLFFLGVCWLAGCGQTDLLGEKAARSDCDWKFEEAQVCAEVEWKNTFQSESPIRGTVQFRALQESALQAPAARGKLRVIAVMQCCGTVVEAQTIEVGPSEFEVVGLEFKSPGTWAVQMEWLDHAGRVVSKARRIYEIR